MNNTYCCVPQCTSIGSQVPPTSFHKFPSDKDESSKRRRLKWIHALKIGKKVNSRMVVCGKHFQPFDFFSRKDGPLCRTNLKKNAVPSLNLPKRSSENKEELDQKKEESLMRRERKNKKVRISGSIESGKKKPKCHMCSKEFVNFANVLEHLRTKHAIWFQNMEYISCCIPGCNSKSHRKIEHSFMVGEENILMFPVPRAYELFNKWKEALKETNIELTKDDHVCENHFLENDVERYFRTKTPEGNIVEIRKKLPTLKYDAVPVKFLKLPSHATEDSSTKTTVSESPIVKNSVVSITDKSSFILNSCDPKKTKNPDDLPVKSSADSFDNFMQGQISYKKNCMLYKEIVKNVQLIKKPSIAWSVVCTDQFTIFAKWNNKFVAEKRLVIESSLTIRVFLKELEIEMTDLVDITSVDDVSLLLEKVENYKMGLAC